MIYFITLVIILFSILFYDIAHFKYKKKAIYNLIIILFWGISTFSYRLGADIINYMYEFQNETVTINNLSFEYLFGTYSRQFGWQLLLSLSKTIIPSFTFLKAIHALIINLSVGFFIYKYFRLKFTALLCYYVYTYIILNFEVLREALSISFFLFSTPYFLKRSFIKYYIMITIAFSFHMSAIILFFIPLLCFISKNKTVMYGLLFCCFVSFLFISKVQELFYNLIFIDSLKHKVYYYFSSENHGSSIFSISNLINYIINILAPLLLVIKERKNNIISQFAPFIIAYVIVYTASLHLAIFYRFNNYFGLFYLFAYLEIFNLKCFFPRLSIKIRKLFLFFSVGLYCFLKLNVIIAPINNIPGYYRYYPYNSIFNEEKNYYREKIYDFVH